MVPQWLFTYNVPRQDDLAIPPVCECKYPVNLWHSFGDAKLVKHLEEQVCIVLGIYPVPCRKFPPIVNLAIGNENSLAFQWLGEIGDNRMQAVGNCVPGFDRDKVLGPFFHFNP